MLLSVKIFDDWMVVEASNSVENFRHLKSFHGSWCCSWPLEDSIRALRLAMAANRFASARFRCSSVISIEEERE